MMQKLVWNDIKNNRLLSAATGIFMAVCTMLFGVTVFLFAGLSSSVSNLMETAKTPDFLQMHSGTVDEKNIEAFARENESVNDWQISRFLNLKNGIITLNGHSLSDSTQDNGLSVQNEKFDFLLSMENKLPTVNTGEVYVPVCYMQEYGLHTSDQMQIGEKSFKIAGFIRDSQMNSMMASSKRFLVNKEDYNNLLPIGQEEYLIEFLLKKGADLTQFSKSYTDAGLPSNGPEITYPLIRMINALSDGMMIFVILLIAVMVLLISMLCVRFILLTGIEKNQREIGMLKAIGVGKRQIRLLYFAKFLYLAAAGMVTGLIAAYFIQKPLSRQIQQLYGKVENGVWIYLLAIICAAIVLAIQLLSLWRLLRRTEKISAINCLQGIPDKKKRGTLRQYIFIGCVTAVSLFLMLTPQNLYSTISSPKFVNYMGIGSGQLRLDIRQTDDISEKTAQIQKCLQENGDISRFTSLQTISCPFELANGTTGNLTVEIGDHTVFPVSYTSGHAPETENELALSILNAKELGLKTGDKLSLTNDTGMKSYTICGIYSDITNGGKTAKAAAVSGKHDVMWSIFYLTLRESVSEYKWINTHQQYWNEIGGGGVKLVSIKEYVNKTNGQIISQIKLASIVAVIVTAVILWVVVLLFMQLVTQQQRYDISLRKALGFSSSGIEKIYLKKCIIAIFTGIAAGLAGGNFIGNLIAQMVLSSMGAAGFTFILDWKMVFVLLPGIVLLIAYFAAKTGVRSIKKIKAYECCMGERN